jgi:hypothetical protein
MFSMSLHSPARHWPSVQPQRRNETVSANVDARPSQGTRAAVSFMFCFPSPRPACDYLTVRR